MTPWGPLDDLTDKQAQKVAWVLMLIEDLDIIPAQYWKKLTNTDDIWEARIQFGGNTGGFTAFLGPRRGERNIAASSPH